MNIVDTLSAKRAALVQKRERLDALVARVNDEIAGIDTAIRVIEKELGLSPTTISPPGKEPGGRLTLRAAIAAVLEQAYPSGLTVHDVIEKVQDAGSTVTQNTASVTLGRIKQEGKARLEGRHWFYVPDTETAGASREEVPAVTSQSIRAEEVETQVL